MWRSPPDVERWGIGGRFGKPFTRSGGKDPGQAGTIRGDVPSLAARTFTSTPASATAGPARAPSWTTSRAWAAWNVIAITDHDTIEGALRAADLAASRPDGPAVIVGEEVSSLQGHILGLFLEKRVRPGMSAAATLEAIHDQAGVAVAAHPSGAPSAAAAAASTVLAGWPPSSTSTRSRSRTPRPASTSSTRCPGACATRRSAPGSATRTRTSSTRSDAAYTTFPGSARRRPSAPRSIERGRSHARQPRPLPGDGAGPIRRLGHRAPAAAQDGGGSIEGKTTIPPLRPPATSPARGEGIERGGHA